MSNKEKSTALARLFSIALIAYFMGCVAVFAYFVRAFGTLPALVLSVMVVLPLLVGVRIRRQWGSVKLRELVYLVVLLMASAGGTIGIAQTWHDHGLAGTIFAPPTEEELCWEKFKKEMSKNPAFRSIKIRYVRGVHWAEGSLTSEEDLDRLLALADQCGIKDRRLDGPYVHSVSITIPGTKDRSKTYD